ncbi:MAG: hypothetical protein IJ054_07305 [Lachnospiraceae bacterium]|nr:hypothetical protein [Lachnospiraceae bacterium]MBQ9199052.1 hypothetical protein [Lachnospiraceae bacterium]
MTEEELKEKIAKLEEIKALQEERVKAAADTLDKAKKRFSRENEKLNRISSEIMKFEGYLFRKSLMKYGIKDFASFEDFLAKNINESMEYENTDNE